jgi:UDP-GlcNAc:undecaprenyl-phosphate/decaprenyl-phosphate GlcNAc-1-phosphate transferase
MDAVLIKSLFAVVISFLITFYIIPLLHTIALRLQVVDVPDGIIKCHSKTTPYLGGIAVYTGFISALALVLPVNSQLTLFFIGLTLLVLIGLIDDLVVMKPHQKFFGQFLAALCFLKAGLYLKEHFFYSIWSILLSLFWMLSIINAFNLVDVMDGLSTTIAASATITFLSIAWYFDQPLLILLLCSFLGPLLAFFCYNRPVAVMYLGDAGSLFVGGFLATIPFFFKWGEYNQYGYLVPLIVLAIPSLEIIGLIVIRTYKHIPFYQGSPDHFSLYLKRRGWRVWDILIFVFISSMLLFAISLLFSCNKISIRATIGFAISFVFLWIATVFLKKPVYRLFF